VLGHQIAQIFDETNEHAVPGRVRERGVECRVEVDPGADIVDALERIGQVGEPFDLLRRPPDGRVSYAWDLEVEADLVQLSVRVSPEQQEPRWPSRGDDASVAGTRAEDSNRAQDAQRLPNHGPADAERSRKIGLRRELVTNRELARLDELDESPTHLLRGARPRDGAVALGRHCPTT
jgi:hypothetical protein